jgi:hypothetical protein
LGLPAKEEEEEAEAEEEEADAAGSGEVGDGAAEPRVDVRRGNTALHNPSVVQKHERKPITS